MCASRTGQLRVALSTQCHCMISRFTTLLLEEAVVLQVQQGSGLTPIQQAQFHSTQQLMQLTAFTPAQQGLTSTCLMLTSFSRMTETLPYNSTLFPEPATMKFQKQSMFCRKLQFSLLP